MRAEVTGGYADGVMTGRVPGYFVWANFTDQEAIVQLPPEIKAGSSITALPNTVEMLKKGSRNWQLLK
jgi:hypothetical protein